VIFSLARAEVNVLVDLLAPAAKAGVTVIDLALLSYNHSAELFKARAAVAPLLEAARSLREENPRLFALLLKSTAGGLVKRLPDLADTDDRWEWVLEAARGIVWTSATGRGERLAIDLLMDLVGPTADLLQAALTRLPSVTIEVAIGETTAPLKATAAQNGVQLSDAEVQKIVEEVLNDPPARARLEALRQSLKEVLPAFTVIAAVLTK
jgi:hypothetical protein